MLKGNGASAPQQPGNHGTLQQQPHHHQRRPSPACQPVTAPSHLPQRNLAAAAAAAYAPCPSSSASYVPRSDFGMRHEPSACPPAHSIPVPGGMAARPAPGAATYESTAFQHYDSCYDYGYCDPYGTFYPASHPCLITGSNGRVYAKGVFPAEPRRLCPVFPYPSPSTAHMPYPPLPPLRMSAHYPYHPPAAAAMVGPGRTYPPPVRPAPVPSMGWQQADHDLIPGAALSSRACQRSSQGCSGSTALAAAAASSLPRTPTALLRSHGSGAFDVARSCSPTPTSCTDPDPFFRCDPDHMPLTSWGSTGMAASASSCGNEGEGRRPLKRGLLLFGHGAETMAAAPTGQGFGAGGLAGDALWDCYESWQQQWQQGAKRARQANVSAGTVAAQASAAAPPQPLPAAAALSGPPAGQHGGSGSGPLLNQQQQQELVPEEDERFWQQLQLDLEMDLHEDMSLHFEPQSSSPSGIATMGSMPACSNSTGPQQTAGAASSPAWPSVLSS